MMFFIVWPFAAIIIGIIGSERTIGFFWSFLGSLLLSPLIGLIFVLTSERKSDKEYKEKMLKLIEAQQNGEQLPVVSVVETPVCPTLIPEATPSKKSYLAIIVAGAVLISFIIGTILISGDNSKLNSIKDISALESQKTMSEADSIILVLKNGGECAPYVIARIFPKIGNINTMVDNEDVEVVNLWSSVDLNRKVKATMTKGTMVCILGREDDYLMIATTGDSVVWGYCMSDFVDM